METVEAFGIANTTRSRRSIHKTEMLTCRHGRRLCRPIQKAPFRNCLMQENELDAVGFFESCVEDTCAAQGNIVLMLSNACQAIEKLAEECEERSYRMGNWKHRSACGK